jgi:hypothetical protein
MPTPALVPNVLTRSTYGDVTDALTRAIADILEESPTKPWLDVLAAQSAFETGEWKLMHDWNVVNLRGTFQGTATTFKAGELDAEGREVLLQPGPHNLFRAYPSLAYGVRDFVRFIFTQSRPDRPNRYAAAADAARAGDVVGYVKNLRGPNPDGTWTIQGQRLGGFFTAVPHIYLAGTERFFRQFEGNEAPAPALV